MQVTNVTCPSSKYSIKCPYLMTPEFIIVHNTANDASAMSEVSYMLGNNNKVSFHAAVDDYRIVTGIPFNRNTYNAGDGKNGRGNRKGIAIEICYSKSGGERFNKAEDLAAQYIAYLLKQYGWGMDRVTKHQDYSGKYCPHRTLDMGWQRFLNKITLYLDAGKPTQNNSGSRAGSYVTTTELNVRSGAGTNCRIVTTLPAGSKQGVNFTNGDWGHLMNGAGWIHLGYCKLMTREKAGSYEITASSLNVRKAPTTSSKSVALLHKGSKQGIDYSCDTWGHLMNDAGWIHLGYCKRFA